METVPSIDLYRELEVDPAATPETIEAAWRSLVKRHHPDIAADRAAAIERIKRVNLAHDWLGDRRLREMYDLTRLRRRHRDVGLDLGARPPSPPGARPTPPVRRAEPPRQRALVSASIVAVLLIGALATVALGPNRTGTVVTASGVAGATGRTPIASLTAGVTSEVEVPTGEPAFAADLPPDCASATGQGQPYRFTFRVDDRPALAYYARCGVDRTYGPLVYVADGGRWDLRIEGKHEKAVPKDHLVGSFTGAADEFAIVWTVGDGVDRWLVLYRVTGQTLESVWNSISAKIPRWGLGRFTYVPNADSSRGSLTVRFADMETGTCRTCSDHVLYVETYEWSARDRAMLLTSHNSVGVGEP